MTSSPRNLIHRMDKNSCTCSQQKERPDSEQFRSSVNRLSTVRRTRHYKIDMSNGPFLHTSGVKLLGSFQPALDSNEQGCISGKVVPTAARVDALFCGTLLKICA